ncbi:hypothetical protein [Pseudomonas sp. RC3H12]|uniref:hypothetical protein n=1 Tax=Pseudomonas sp. RC3H12 TaxID=2834406 RepID=UPI001BDEA0FC|nr:hypothetical protein [Pseudomonas sp. RC3H12]QWA30509.1 hypothetical protein KHO27_06435 [Pseudomonas sp. RC3H12]
MMINLSKDKAVWLVPEGEVIAAFKKAVSFVRNIYRKASKGRGSSAEKIEYCFNSYGLDFSGWELAHIERLLESTYRGSNTRIGDIDRSYHGLPESYDMTLSQFVRMVFITLWARKVFIAPLSIQTINHQVEIFDELCCNLDLECLTIIRGVHPDSEIESIYKRDEFNDGSSRVSFWLRLLLSTDFYTVDDITEEGCKVLFDGANGSGKLPLRRYYVNDFLLTITHPRPSSKKMVESIISGYQEVKRKCKPERVYKGRRIATKTKHMKSSAQQAHEAALKMARSLANGETEFNFELMFKTHFPAHRIKGLFSLGESNDRLPFFEESHPQVKNFAMHMDQVFGSFMKSKRLQRSSNYSFLRNLYMSYLTAYLPSFYMRRDGSLENYPRTLNEFNCSLYFTHESVFLDGVIRFDKVPPRTFLGYMEEYARAHGWVNETHYARVLVIDHFCQYIESNRLVLPDADKFKCNFTSACYPAVEKKSGTKKRPIPRPYFATFLSMLYSLEISLIISIICRTMMVRMKKILTVGS